jgi:hypothetical protein
MWQVADMTYLGVPWRRRGVLSLLLAIILVAAVEAFWRHG